MSDIHTALERTAKDAGLKVMGEVLSILYNRETVKPDRLLALTADDLEELYGAFIAPAINAIEDWLLEGAEA